MSAAAKRSVDIFQPDVQWVGGATAIVKICHIAEAAGISVIPHGGLNDAYGQHVCYAMPAVPWGELSSTTAPGVPLGQGPGSRSTPGMTFPVNGRLVPNDGPGFGIELTLEDLEAAARR
jgi:L-rhamnonate dehydratase